MALSKEEENARARARYHANREKELARQAKWRGENKEYFKEWARAHPDRINAASNKWKDANRAHVRKFCAEYHGQHAERLNAKKRAVRATPEGSAAQAARNKAWNKANMGARLGFNRRYNYSLTEAHGSHTESEINALFEQQCGLCANPFCRVELNRTGGSRVRFNRDHVQPLSAGGSDRIANIQLLCPPCNSRKHDACQEVFLEREARRNLAKAV